MQERWFHKYMKVKPEKAVIKLRNEDGSFWKSIIIPTSLYPLNGKCEVFTCDNTEIVTSEEILSIFDRHEYNMGWCYQNTERLSKDLLKNGYNAVTYAGWLFTSETDLPIHHCWTVLDGKYILDPSDFYSVFFSENNIKNFAETKDREDFVSVLASFMEAAKKEKHSTVCAPVGKVSGNLVYVGCPCTPKQGREIYRNLMRQYPDHECDRTDGQGLNPTQQLMLKAGLMKL